MSRTTNLAHGVEYGLAAGPGAHDRVVLDGRQVCALLERRVQRAQRHHHPRGLEARRRPHVPREAHAVAVLVLLHVLRVGRHLEVYGVFLVLRLRVDVFDSATSALFWPYFVRLRGG